MATPFQTFRSPQVRASAAVLPCVVIYYTGENQAATATSKTTHRPLGVTAEFTKYRPSPEISNVNHADSGDPITYFTYGTSAQVQFTGVAVANDAEVSFSAAGLGQLATTGDYVIGRTNHAVAANAKGEVRLEQPYIKA